MQTIISALLVLIMTGIFQAAFAVEGESIVFNPTTGNYLITHYSDFDRKFEQLIFIPATKINPIIKTRLKLGREGEVHYGYTLISGGDSQQVIRRFLLNPVSNVTTSLPDVPLNAPPGNIMGDMMNTANNFDTSVPWRASMGYSDDQMSFRIGWYYNTNTGGLSPGSKAVFGFNSHDLPGIIQAEVHGYAPDSQKIDGEENPDEEDGGFGQQYFNLLRNNFLRRPVAVPAIAVPSPFDASVLLDRIQTQMHSWIGKQLLDATFSAQLDRSFQAAISAYRLNQPKVGKQQIQTMRELIKKEQPEADKEDGKDDRSEKGDDEDKTRRALIDKLAARVLDFDLNYVLKRMGGDKDD